MSSGIEVRWSVGYLPPPQCGHVQIPKISPDLGYLGDRSLLGCWSPVGPAVVPAALPESSHGSLLPVRDPARSPLAENPSGPPGGLLRPFPGMIRRCRDPTSPRSASGSSHVSGRDASRCQV